MKLCIKCFLIFLISLSVCAAYAFFAYGGIFGQSEIANFSFVKNLSERRFGIISSNGENPRINGFYSNAEDGRLTWDMTHPDLSVPRAVFCGKLSEKYVLSSDGTVWMYGENYFISFDAGLPTLAVCSVRGIGRGDSRDLSRLMASKELFCSTSAYDCVSVGSSPGITARVFRGTGEKSGDVFCVTADGFSSPVLYDFSRFFENREF